MFALLDVQSDLSFPIGGCAVERLVRHAAERGVTGIALADRGSRCAAPAFVRAARAAGIRPVVGARFDLAEIEGAELILYPTRASGARLIEATAAQRTCLAVGEVPTGADGDIVALLQLPQPTPPTPPAPPAQSVARVRTESDQPAEREQAPEQTNRPVSLPVSVSEGGAPVNLASVRQLSQRLGDRLHLAVPGPATPWLVALGRDLGIPVVLAPVIRIVDAEESSLHRLLVSIRGDHEGHDAVRRPGQPARRSSACSRHHSLSACHLEHPAEAAESARQLFTQLMEEMEATAPMTADGAPVRDDAPPATTSDSGDSGLSGLSGLSRISAVARVSRVSRVYDQQACEVILQRVASRASAAGRLPSRERLEREIDALASRGALEPLAELADLLRRLSSRMLVLPVSPGWSGSWVGWGLGITLEAPADDQEPTWLDPLQPDTPLPDIHLEVPSGEEGSVRGALDLLGGRTPLEVRRLTAAEGGRWLARDRQLAAADARALQSLIRGQRPGRHPSRGSKLGSLASLAWELDGKPLALRPDRDARQISSTYATAARRGAAIDLLTDDARRLPGVLVRVKGSAGLAVIMRAAGSGWTSTLPGRRQHFDIGELESLLAGPLANGNRVHLRRMLATRAAADGGSSAATDSWTEARSADSARSGPPNRFAPAGRWMTVDGLARCLAVEARRATAPATRFKLRLAEGESESVEILFQEDLLRLLHRAAGLDGGDVRSMIALVKAGRGADLAQLRRRFALGAAQREHDPAVAEQVFSTLCLAVPHLEARATYLARAIIYAALANLAAASPPVFLAALLDQAKGKSKMLAEVQRWAALHGIQMEPADLAASDVLTTVSPSAGPRHRVRLGLIHLPGVTKVAAAIIAAARQQGDFTGRDDFLRRLKGRLPEPLLGRLLDTGLEHTGELTPDDLLSGERRPRSSRRSSRQSTQRTAAPRARSKRSRLLPGGVLQTDLFAELESPRSSVYTPAMARFGILPLARVGGLPAGSRLRVAGEIQPIHGLLTRGGRQLASTELVDGDHSMVLLVTPALLEGGVRGETDHGERGGVALPLGRGVVVEGRLTMHAGHPELIVESAVPVGMLDRSMQPALEIVVPPGFRRLRALRLRLLDSPGLSPVRIRGGDQRIRDELESLERLRVAPDGTLIAELKRMVGTENVHLVGRVERTAQ